MYSPENVFPQPFCLQRATSPVAQEIGQLRYRVSSKPQSWLLAQILAFSFPFALWKQLCHLSARQMLPSGTLCLAPKNGIWLHLTHRHLARKPAAGPLACGAPWQAAGPRGGRAASPDRGEAPGKEGKGSRAEAASAWISQASSRERFCFLSRFSLELTEKKERERKRHRIKVLTSASGFCSAGNGPPTALAKGRAARRTCGPRTCGSITKKWR